MVTAKKAAALLKKYNAAFLKNEDTKAAAIKSAAKDQGFSFANWKEGEGYTSCYTRAGLDRLTDCGYQVIQVF